MNLQPAALRDIELHEARAHAHGDRTVTDLGDAILLADAVEADPFLNRVSGLRLPDDAVACDRRLIELYTLFATLGRRPHAWVWPGVTKPSGLSERLGVDGFVDVGGTRVMVLEGRPAPAPLPEGARLERLATAGDRGADIVALAARVMVDAFGAVAGSPDVVAVDLARTPVPKWDIALITVDDEPVAAGRRYSADGMTHLSSIATSPGWWGRGFGTAVTAALAEDGQRAGGRLVHLAVEDDNGRAQRLYRRLGFEVVGARVADLLL